MLFGEPPVLWDSIQRHTFRQGISVRVSPSAPLPKGEKGYPNIVLESDRVVQVAMQMPGATHAEIGRSLGLSANWVGDLLRIGRLPESIKEYVRSLGLRLKRSQVAGIDLRRIAGLRDPEEQVRRFEVILKMRDLPLPASSPR